jgi:hypothetical protein
MELVFGTQDVSQTHTIISFVNLIENLEIGCVWLLQCTNSECGFKG